MSLVNTKTMLLNARKGKYAIGAFNIENMEMAQAVIYAARDLESPVICAVSENAMKYADAGLFYANVLYLANNVDVSVAIHVDHAESEAVVMKALRAGFTSIMIDGSKETFRDNLELTKRIVHICNIFDIPVEGELGAIGGKIDSAPDSKLIYTDPYAALDFVNQTGISSLAVAIGTVHGFYKAEPRLDYDRLQEISELVDVPLVLHGASGLSDDQIISCIEKGISKINMATELRAAYTKAIRTYLDNDKNVYDPKKFSREARNAVYELVKNRIMLFGSAGKCH